MKQQKFEVSKRCQTAARYVNSTYAVVVKNGRSRIYVASIPDYLHKPKLMAECIAKALNKQANAIIIPIMHELPDPDSILDKEHKYMKATQYKDYLRKLTGIPKRE